MNINQADVMLDYFVKQLNVHQVKFNLIKENAFSPESTELSDINDSEIDKFFDVLIKKIVQLNQEGYQIYERNICDKMMNLLSKRTRNICSSKGCVGGYKIISFNGKGDIFPCDMLDHEEVRIGNIKESNLLHMIEESIEKNRFFKKKENENCETCPWHGYCEGGCTASVIYAGKSQIDGMECKVNQILYPKLINILLTKPEIVQYLTNYQINVLRR